ncbi:unnamed protein product [Eruca vesicaria subsp. sativa]|uniref:Uncharacterized protein n=1 Tax=Eruca vesicaria subsp. sativa TaxID=29727 RepID=A0ABC8K3X8_ERUVS|nr:unnamed protein product [Eruca vesicaria subsp. sativa]
MQLRSSISNTRKFFQKTIDNFKSLFSNNDTYHKLPKTPNNPCMKNHYHHQSQNIIISSSSQTPSIHTPFEPKPRDYVTKDSALTKQRRRGDGDDTVISEPEVELVRLKLEEMEKIMMNIDIQNDEEHASDVREFMHCYSRLRCAAYIDVVELFFMEVYSDFFSSQPPENTRVTVRPRYTPQLSVRSFNGKKN